MKSALLALGALAALLACAACTNDDPGTDGTGPGKPVIAPAPTPQPAPRPSDLAPMDVSSAAASAAPAAASAASDAGAAPAASSSAPGKTAAPATSGKAAMACGDKPLPPCPLYAWMKANTSTAMSASDFDALATALDKVVTFAPTGYTNWASISKDGASAARAQNLDAVKAACRSCHTQYKDKYKKELRDRPI